MSGSLFFCPKKPGMEISGFTAELIFYNKINMLKAKLSGEGLSAVSPFRYANFGLQTKFRFAQYERSDAEHGCPSAAGLLSAAKSTPADSIFRIVIVVQLPLPLAALPHVRFRSLNTERFSRISPDALRVVLENGDGRIGIHEVDVYVAVDAEDDAAAAGADNARQKIRRDGREAPEHGGNGNQRILRFSGPQFFPVGGILRMDDFSLSVDQAFNLLFIVHHENSSLFLSPGHCPCRDQSMHAVPFSRTHSKKRCCHHA